MNIALLRYSRNRTSASPFRTLQQLRNSSSSSTRSRSRFAPAAAKGTAAASDATGTTSTHATVSKATIKNSATSTSSRAETGETDAEFARNSSLLKKITEITSMIEETAPNQTNNHKSPKLKRQNYVKQQNESYWKSQNAKEVQQVVEAVSEKNKEPVNYLRRKDDTVKEVKKTHKENPPKKANPPSENKEKKTKEREPAAETKKPVFKPVEKALPQLNIPKFITVANLSTQLRVRLPAFLKKLEELEFENMTHDFILDADTAALIVQEYGYEAVVNDVLGADLFPSPPGTDPKKLKPRAPIVTIMGHVDHGKTTILDYLRKSSIVKGEHGGITQHIGAFSVKTPISKKVITFLDTPGHAAFLKMRERGANMTDIVVLVVAAEDSVMPQTLEAIKHAKSAGVSIVVAINKCDKEDANPDKVVADLSRYGIDVEDYGGEVPVVRVSGKTGLNMDSLEETIITVSDMLELTAEEKNIPVEGWIVESQMKKGLGNVATMLIKKGTLKPGAILVAGTTYCKVRAMKDESGKSIKSAGPSVPVEITGWRELPEAGEVTLEAKNESYAKQVISNREKRNAVLHETEQIESINNQRWLEIEQKAREDKIQEYQLEGLTLEEIQQLEPELFAEVDTKIKKIPFIIKADVSGSAEAVAESIKGLGNEEVQSLVIYQEVGPPSESDVDRAESSGAQILAFNIKTPKDVMNSASAAGVVVKEFNVIYHLIEDVLATLVKALPPIFETKVLSTADVREIFEITVKKASKPIKIAGCKVSNGVLQRTGSVRLMRDGEEIYRGSIRQLKVHKDDVSEVKNGADCGVCLDDASVEILAGDVIENIEEVPIKRHL